MSPPIINPGAMTDSVSFKAYLKRDGQEVEVRRFGVDSGAATSYVYLRSKIQAVFPTIHNDQFQIFWQDVDQDYIRMDSDEELFEALTSSNQRPLKVYIHVQNGQGAGAGTAGRQTHPGVSCDGCEGPVVGFRYKCVTCPDYDLCSRCEANGLHEHHFMLRMPTPMDSVLRHPKFIRKLFSHPHKFHKRHGWGRPRGCGDSQAGAPPPPAKCPAMAGVTDMFDFSALMELLESVGVFGEATNQSAGPGPTAAPAEGTSGSQAQGPSGGQRAREGPSGERRESTGSRGAEYLTNIGQMVAAILDPLGVDVTFDVRTKTSQGQTADATSADPSPAPTPAPAKTPSAPASASYAPTQAPNASAQASNAPTQAPNASAQASNAPTQAPNASAQASNAPTQTSNAPTQASNAPAQTSNAPTQASNGPPMTPITLAEVLKKNTLTSRLDAPVDTPYWLTQTPAQPSFYRTPDRMAAALPDDDFPAPAQANVAPPAGPATTQIDFPVAGAVEVNAGPAPAVERRNSDDWTLINRESPTRAEASAMDVDESQGARPKDGPAPLYPSIGQPGPAPHGPSAPPQDDLSNADRKRIQDALEMFRAMGFSFDPDRLRDLLKKQNCDIFSVLEIMLNTERK